MGELCRDKSKTLLPLGEREPVLERTLRSIIAAQVADRIIIAIREQDEHEVRAVVQRLGDAVPCTIVCGGEQRQDSVRAGLSAASNAEFVFVHDAARPFCPPELIRAVCAAAVEHQAAILALPVKPSLKVPQIRTISCAYSESML